MTPPISPATRSSVRQARRASSIDRLEGGYRTPSKPSPKQVSQARRPRATASQAEGSSPPATQRKVSLERGDGLDDNDVDAQDNLREALRRSATGHHRPSTSIPGRMLTTSAGKQTRRRSLAVHRSPEIEQTTNIAEESSDALIGLDVAHFSQPVSHERKCAGREEAEERNDRMAQLRARLKQTSEEAREDHERRKSQRAADKATRLATRLSHKQKGQDEGAEISALAQPDNSLPSGSSTVALQRISSARRKRQPLPVTVSSCPPAEAVSASSSSSASSHASEDNSPPTSPPSEDWQLLTEASKLPPPNFDREAVPTVLGSRLQSVRSRRLSRASLTSDIASADLAGTTPSLLDAAAQQLDYTHVQNSPVATRETKKSAEKHQQRLLESERNSDLAGNSPRKRGLPSSHSVALEKQGGGMTFLEKARAARKQARDAASRRDSIYAEAGPQSTESPIQEEAEGDTPALKNSRDLPLQSSVNKTGVRGAASLRATRRWSASPAEAVKSEDGGTSLLLTSSAATSLEPAQESHSEPVPRLSAAGRVVQAQREALEAERRRSLFSRQRSSAADGDLTAASVSSARSPQASETVSGSRRRVSHARHSSAAPVRHNIGGEYAVAASPRVTSSHPSRCLRGIVVLVDIRDADGHDLSSRWTSLLRDSGAKVANRIPSADSKYKVTHIVWKNAKPCTLRYFRSIELTEHPHVVGLNWLIRCLQESRQVEEKEHLVEIGRAALLEQQRQQRQCLWLEAQLSSCSQDSRKSDESWRGSFLQNRRESWHKNVRCSQPLSDLSDKVSSSAIPSAARPRRSAESTIGIPADRLEEVKKQALAHAPLAPSPLRFEMSE